jgi:hypothetical protein
VLVQLARQNDRFAKRKKDRVIAVAKKEKELNALNVW